MKTPEYRENIIDYLDLQCAELLNPDLESVEIVQTPTELYLELHFTSDPQKVVQEDLTFIDSMGPELDFQINYMEILDCDNYCLLLISEELFTEEAVEKILDAFDGPKLSEDFIILGKYLDLAKATIPCNYCFANSLLINNSLIKN